MIGTLIRSTVAVAALAAAGVAQAFVLTTGEYKIEFGNYDSGTLYSNPAGSAPASGVVCGSLDNAGGVGDITACDTAAYLKAPGSVGSVNTSADSMGILSVTKISRVADNFIYFQAGAGNYLTGVFGGLTDFFVTNSTSGGLNPQPLTETLSRGGQFWIYANTIDYDPTCGPTACGDLNAGQYLPSITGGTLFLSGVFVDGAAFTGDTAASYYSSFNPNTLAGQGVGFLNFTGGTALAMFDQNGVTDNNGGIVDAKLSTTFFAPNPNNNPGNWTVISSSQITGVVPEPGSLALVAAALLSAGAVARRRQRS